MKIRLPGFGRFDAHVEPYNEFPDVSPDVQQTVSRIAGYDQDNELFRHIRVNDDGRLPVLLDNLNPITWVVDYTTSMAFGAPQLLLGNYPLIPSNIVYLVHVHYAAASASNLIYIYKGTKNIWRSYHTGYPIDCNMLAHPIALDISGTGGVYLQCSQTVAHSAAWSIAFLGNVGTPEAG